MKTSVTQSATCRGVYLVLNHAYTNGKYKLTQIKSTATIFIKLKQVPRNRLELFEQEIPSSAEAKYLGIHPESSFTLEAHIKLRKIKHCNTL
jgi:hypothetical protein